MRIGESLKANHFNVPNGVYKATWSGWKVRLYINEKQEYEAETSVGIRGTVKCMAIVDNGKIVLYE